MMRVVYFTHIFMFSSLFYFLPLGRSTVSCSGRRLLLFYYDDAGGVSEVEFDVGGVCKKEEKN